MPEGFITDIDSEILREVLTIASDDGKIGKTADGLHFERNNGLFGRTLVT